jgi:hypothetical protein
MPSATTINYILGIIALLNVGVIVWNSIRKPQEKSEINDAVFGVEVKNLSDKFGVDIKNISEKFDDKFTNMKESVVKVMQNDLQEVKKLMTDHITEQNVIEREMADKFARIDTKLEFLMKK